MRSPLATCFIGLVSMAFAQPLKEDARFLQTLMQQHPDQFKNILDKRKTYEVQIIYTQINRDQNNKPEFKTFQYNALWLGSVLRWRNCGFEPGWSPCERRQRRAGVVRIGHKHHSFWFEREIGDLVGRMLERKG